MMGKRSAAIDWNSHFVSVYRGRDCAGHLIAARGKSWKAVAADERDLGTFPDKDAARAAVLASFDASGEASR
jgi:hypothetical protein